MAARTCESCRLRGRIYPVLGARLLFFEAPPWVFIVLYTATMNTIDATTNGLSMNSLIIFTPQKRGEPG